MPADTAALPRAASLKLTYEDYLAIPKDRHRHEIIGGEEHVTASPSSQHQRISRKLLVALSNHVDEHGLGEVFDAPMDVRFSDVDVVQPDVLFIAEARRGIVKEQVIDGPPTLIAEVLSEDNRRNDEIRKRKLYARFGVAEYWVVDPALGAVKVYRPGGGDAKQHGDYERAAELTTEADGATLTTPLLPDFALPLADLFARR